MNGPYALWTSSKSWCEHEVAVEPTYLPAIRSLFDDPWFDGNEMLELPVDLVPEPHGSRGEWAVSIRARGRTLGYLDATIESAWAPVVRRIAASGFVPRTNGKVWGRNYESWEGADEFEASLYVCLGEPHEALPLNDPPREPYTIVPRSSAVRVTKVDQHFDVLLKSVPHGGRGVLFVTLHERGPLDARSKSHVEVRIGNKRVGQLTPQTSIRFLPMICRLRDRGLLTVCQAEIVGSAVAAELRIHAAKANEVSDEFLSGESPIQLPALHPHLHDPRSYDLTSAAQLIRPVAPVAVLHRPISSEPGDGEVVRFSRSEDRYTYVAVRRGAAWLTTATSNVGAVTQVMTWDDLARRSRQFELATSWNLVRHQVYLVQQKLAVVRFMLNRNYLAAINIADTGYYDGDWYTTIPDFMEAQLPFGSCARWTDIAQYGQDIWIATAWEPL